MVSGGGVFFKENMHRQTCSGGGKCFGNLTTRMMIAQ